MKNFIKNIILLFAVISLLSVPSFSFAQFDGSWDTGSSYTSGSWDTASYGNSGTWTTDSVSNSGTWTQTPTTVNSTGVTGVYFNVGSSPYGYYSYGYSNYGGSYVAPTILNTTVNCPSGSTLSNGICVINNTQCPSGTTLVGGVCTVNSTTTCPAGSSLINGVCTVNTVNCPAGSYLSNGVCTYASVNYGSVNYGYTNYNNGYNYGYTNYNTYQTCWDGSVIPSNQACAAQYKTCSSGSVVLISQTCYKTCFNGSTIPDYQSCPYTSTQNTYNQNVVYPTVVKFNNVVTSPSTQITNNSARCNGVGLIANGVASTGWFEYGETANLGRDTTKTSIGTNATSPFSNVLTNLKPSTKYYCRAVMNNQYGTVKGSIVSFTTKATTVTYVAPKPQVVVSTAKKATVTQTKVKKDEVICVDGAVTKVTNESQSVLLNAGQKLATVQLEKVSGNIYPSSSLNYKLNFKNVSSGRLNDVVIKIVIPEDFTFVSTNVGSYDEDSRTINFSQSVLDPYVEGIVSFKVDVNRNAEIGKSVVTTGYLSYTILSSDGKNVADEVTTYSVSSITPNLENQGLDTGAKKVIGASATSSKTFLPNTLIEWLALISIMFILFILGRSIYSTYQNEEEKSH